MIKIKQYLLILTLLFLISCKQKGSFPHVNEGVLDLSDVGADSLDLISLQGTWSFYWKQIPIDANGVFNKKLLVNKETLDFSKSSWKENKHPAKGYGTYRLKITLTDTVSNYKLKLSRIKSSAIVIINGKEVDQLGKFSTKEEDAIANGKPMYINIPKEKEIDLMILVSNYHHRKGGGFLFNTFFGKVEEVFSSQKRAMFIETGLFLIVFIISAYHLFVFFDSKKYFLLFFALASIFKGVRILFVGEVLIYDLFPDMSFVTIQLWRYITHHLSVVFFIIYFNFFLARFRVKWLGNLIIFGMLSSFLYTVFTPTFESTYISMIHFSLGWLGLFYGLLISAMAFREKIKYSGLILTSAIVAITLMGTELLHIKNVVDFAYISNPAITGNLGILIYLVLQTIINYLKNKESNLKILDLSDQVFKLNEDVNSKKEEVTFLISESILQLQEKEKVTHKLDSVRKQVNNNDLNEVVARLKSKKLQESRKLIFKENMRELSVEFLLKIKNKYSNLTKNEIETCMMIHLGFSSEEICNLKAISPLTLKSSRYRIRKKMNLPKEVILKDYLKNF